MPRTVQIHLVSMLVGVGFALLGIVAMGQMQAGQHARFTPPSVAATVTPSSWVQVREGAPYTVPAGFVFVAEAVGVDRVSGSATNTTLFVDGAPRATYLSGTAPVSMVSLPPGCSALAGSQVSLGNTSNPSLKGQVWGFLVDASGLPVVHAPIPGPGTWIIVEEGSPFLVPPGKVMVVTAIGGPSCGNASVSIDGVVVGSTKPGDFVEQGSCPPTLPRGLSAASGSTVEAVDAVAGSGARVWGYLVDA